MQAQLPIHHCSCFLLLRARTAMYPAACHCAEWQLGWLSVHWERSTVVTGKR